MYTNPPKRINFGCVPEPIYQMQLTYKSGHFFGNVVQDDEDDIYGG